MPGTGANESYDAVDRREAAARASLESHRGVDDREAAVQHGTEEERIVRAIQAKFRTFGGGHATPGNPIAHALKDAPAQFAAGVDVAEVVRYVRAAQDDGAWERLKEDYHRQYARANAAESRLTALTADLDAARKQLSVSRAEILVIGGALRAGSATRVQLGQLAARIRGYLAARSVPHAAPEDRP